ncbi:MAG: O-antigen ligase family protein [Methanococcaceae archaeon]
MCLVIYFMIITAVWNGESNSIITAIGLIPFISFIYFYNIRRSWNYNKYLILALFSIPHLIALILFYLNISKYAFSLSAVRFQGFHKDPNFLGSILLISIIAKIILIKRYRFYARYIMVALFAADIFMLLLTVSRGTLFSLLLILAIWLIIEKRYILITLITIIYFTVLLPLMDSIFKYSSWGDSPVEYFLARIKEAGIGNSSGKLSDIRFELWKKVFELMDGKYFMGVTVDNFVKSTGYYPHNTFADIYLDLGAIGGIAFIVLILAGIWNFYKKYYKTNLIEKNEKSFLLIGLAVLISMFFLSNLTLKLFWFIIINIISYSFKKQSLEYKTNG